jgi:6-phosphogluconolactonase
MFSTRMKFSRLFWLGLSAGLLLFTTPRAVAAGSGPRWVYFGTYTTGKSQGIYVSRFDAATGKLSPPELAAETKNPSFLALHPTHRFLYAVGETTDSDRKRIGAVNAFSLDPKTGKLVFLNQQPSGGVGPCHLAVDRAGKCVLAANYGSGSIIALPLQADGRLGGPGVVMQHQGSSVNLQRQAGPHAHFILPDPANRFALTCDLGLDKVLIYRLEANTASLLGPPTPVEIKPGSGPRHLAFDPSGRFVYVINEISSTLAAFAYDGEHGALKELQTVSTLPEDFKDANTAAEVQVHPSGRFVYGSNRGHNSIAVFAVDAKSGKLTFIEHQPTQGKTPRHFALSPSGNWLLAENQDSDNVVVFRVDPKSGRLTPTGQALELGSPSCSLFLD